MVKFTEDAKKSGFSLMPEGKHILKVEEMKAVRQNGKVKALKLVASNKAGQKVFNNYTLDQRKPYFEGAMKALWSLLHTGCALEEDENGEIAEEDAVGSYFIAQIKHIKSDDGRVFVNLGWIEGHAESFDDEIESDETKEDTEDSDEDELDPYA